MTVSYMGWTRGCESASSLCAIGRINPRGARYCRGWLPKTLRYSMLINKLRESRHSKHWHGLKILHPSSAKTLARHCLLASREQQELTHSGGAPV